MTTKYRNIDAPTRAQACRIDWELIIEQDDCTDRPDERDDGFWPSTDPQAAGFIGAGADYQEAFSKAQARMDAWQAGDWHYVGVIARAHILIPIGQGSFVTHTLDSAGLWGIESDAGDYLREVFADEKAELTRQLETLGQALGSNLVIHADR